MLFGSNSEREAKLTSCKSNKNMDYKGCTGVQNTQHCVHKRTSKPQEQADTIDAAIAKKETSWLEACVDKGQKSFRMS